MFLVDDQYAPLTPKIKAAVAALTDKPVPLRAQHALARRPHRRQREPRRGGRAHRGPRQRAQAHEHRAVHRAFDEKCRPRRRGALPVVTFTRRRHLPPQRRRDPRLPRAARAHRRRRGRALPQGQRRPHGRPVLQRHVSVHRRLQRRHRRGHDRRRGPRAGPGRTTARKIIPGHGPLATKADLKAFRDMLVAVRDAVEPLVKAGKTLEQVMAAKPMAAFDAKWGKGFIKPDVFVGIVYADLARAPRSNQNARVLTVRAFSSALSSARAFSSSAFCFPSTRGELRSRASSASTMASATVARMNHFVGGDDVPGRLLGARVPDHVLVGGHVLVPVSPLRAVLQRRTSSSSPARRGGPGSACAAPPGRRSGRT